MTQASVGAPVTAVTFSSAPGSYGPGAANNATFRLVVRVNQGISSGTVIAENATAATTATNAAGNDTPSTALTAVINSDISITNVASATVFSTPKDVTYTITVINTVSDATVNLTLSNPSSGAVIVPGASATLGAQSTATLTILAGPPMLLGPAALPDAEVGIAYANQDITASGEPGRG